MKKFITLVLAVVCVVASVIGLAGCFSSTEEAKVLSTPTELRIDGGCLCWNPVDNAVKYTVSIDGAEDISEDTKYSVEKVKDGEHIFKVKANGDGLIFLSSGFSDELKVSLVGGSLSSEGYYSQFDELTKKESFLGYGFDVIESSVFSDKYVKTSFPIFNTDKLMEQRLLKVDSKQSNVEETQASSIEEFMQSWNAKANVDVSWGKKRIGGSVGVEANYEGGVENAKSKYFHCISINNQKFYIVLQSDLDTYRNILNEGFMRDLYSDMEPAELFKNYGTHFITSAVMGGKINSYYLYSSEEEQSYHDVSAKVSVEVRYLVGETDVEVSGGYRQYASEKNVYIKNTLEVIGGGDHGMLSDADIGAKYADWEKSLNEHASLMGIKDSSSLIPIWKLIDASKDTKTYSWNYGNDGENSFIGEGSRAQQLQAYFDAYGIDSYNSLMKAAGLPEIKSAEAIQDIKINNNNKPSDNGAYAVYAGARNAISFTVKPDDATGYTKAAIISGECEYAEIINDKEGLAVKIAANAPANTTIDLVVSAGSVSEVVKLRIHKEHDVIFNSNGGSSVEKITVEHDSQIDEPTAPTKKGFDFKGWYTDPNFDEQTLFKFGQQAIVDNITLYAKWSKKIFTVKYVSEVGNAPEDKKAEYETTIEKPSDPVHEGYDFVDFYADEDFTQKFDFSNKITENTTIYLKWEIKTFTITFDANGGNIVGNTTISKNYKENIIESECPKCEREDYAFGGWYIDKECTKLLESVKNDMTLYARWIESSVTITVKFETDREISFNDKYVKYGESLGDNLPSVEDRNGYAFLGWYKENTYQTKVESDTKLNTENFESISENEAATITLYAKWNKKISIRYDENANETVDGQETKGEFIVNDGGVTEISYKVTQLGLACSKTYKEYYDFLGWYTSAANGIQLADENGVLLKNVSGYTDKNGKWIYQESDSVTLYAYWKQTYTDYIYISNAQEFVKISENPSGKYMLIDDIDMAKAVWEPITSFSGELNGESHCIYNFIIKKLDGSGSDTIAFIKENVGNITNLTIGKEGVTSYSEKYSVQYIIRYTEDTNESLLSVGGLVVENKGTIKGCSIINTFINVTFIDNNNNKDLKLIVGGIAAINLNEISDSCVRNSYIDTDATCPKVSGDDNYSWLGGVCGVNGCNINDCKVINTKLDLFVEGYGGKGNWGKINESNLSGTLGGIVAEQTKGSTLGCSTDLNTQEEMCIEGKKNHTSDNFIENKGEYYGVCSGGVFETKGVVLFDDTIRTEKTKINGSGHYITAKFEISESDRNFVETKNYSKLDITIKCDIAKVNSCNQYYYLTNGEYTLLSEQTNCTNADWQTYTFEKTVDLNELASNEFVFKCQAQNDLFKDFYIGTVVASVVAVK